VHFTGSNVVCMGDTVYTSNGELMLSPIAWNGGDAQSLAKNLAALLPQLAPDVKVVPGHGPLLTLDDLKTYHRLLVQTLEIARQRLAAGQKFAEIIAQGLPPEMTRGGKWKISAEEWLGIACQSLARKQ
jgi:cyclase